MVTGLTVGAAFLPPPLLPKVDFLPQPSVSRPVSSSSLASILPLADRLEAVCPVNYQFTKR